MIESLPIATKNIHQRILAIMAELDYIEKGLATVNGQYRFVSHDQVTSKIHPLLVKHGVTIVPSIEDMAQDGNRTTVKLVIGFFNADNPQDCFNVRYIAHGIDGGGVNKQGQPIPVGDKGPGKAISYAYKYALLKTFCLETGLDPDNDANAAYEPAKCLEFDSLLPADYWEEKEKINEFVDHIASTMGKHAEEIKKEATTRMSNFLVAYDNWRVRSKSVSTS